MQQPKRVFLTYTKTYYTALLSGLVILAGINVVADPELIYQIVSIKGFNQSKPFNATTGSRRVKSMNLKMGNYNTIILGTSRALGGLDPLHSALKSKNAYNAALGGTNLYQIYKVFEFSRRHLPLQTVIFGLDHDIFLGGEIDEAQESLSGDFINSGFAGKNSIQLHLNSLLSMRSLNYSLQTILFNIKGLQLEVEDTSRGFRNQINQNLQHRQLFNRRHKRDLSISWETNISSEKLNLFRKIIQICRENNIQLYLFISPVHARQLEVLHILGVNSSDQWKRDLVKILAEDALLHPNSPPILLWDFSGYNSITTEPVPSLDSKQKMRWYTESSHYKKHLGDLILDLILNYPEKVRNVPNDFGIILNHTNIESHLAHLRTERKKYIKKFPQDLGEIKQIATQIGKQK